MKDKWKRPSAKVQRDKRWPALRQAARRRDNWCCVKCGHRGRIEVDHIKPVRDAPELAFDLTNLQCLCRQCHSRKTRIEMGLAPYDPEQSKFIAHIRSLTGERRSE